MFRVHVRIHQFGELVGHAQTYFDHPSFAVGVVVNHLGAIIEFLVDFNDLTRHWRKELADRFVGLDLTKVIASFVFRTDFRQLDIGDVAKLGLRMPWTCKNIHRTGWSVFPTNSP